jgi:hypothetical protein
MPPAQRSAPPYGQRPGPPGAPRADGASWPVAQRPAPPGARRPGPPHSAPPTELLTPAYPSSPVRDQRRRGSAYQSSEVTGRLDRADGTATSTALGRSGAADDDARNPAAIAALTLGLLGVSLFAIVFGVVGRKRAKAIGRGRGIATAGLVLGLLFLVLEGGAAAVVLRPSLADIVRPHSSSSAQSDPGCIAAESSHAVATMDTDAKTGNLTKLITDFRAVSADMTAAATQTSDSVAAAAMRQFATDLTTYANSLSKGQAFTQAEVTKFIEDAAAVDKACGP